MHKPEAAHMHRRQTRCSLARVATTLLAIFLYTTPACPGAEVAIGDTLERVGEIMGAPTGKYRSGDLMVYAYRRGTVEFRNGRVSRTELLSTEEADRRTRKRKAENARLRRQAEQSRERRIAVGGSIKAEKPADPAFSGLPATQRLSFWLQFKRQYPETDVSTELTEARRQVAELQAAKRSAEEAVAAQDRTMEMALRVITLEEEYYGPVHIKRRIAIAEERATLAVQLIDSVNAVIDAKKVAAEKAIQEVKNEEAGAPVDPAHAALIDTLEDLAADINRTGGRLSELDADYAVSLANWKRNEIDRTRGALVDSLLDACQQVMDAGTPQDGEPEPDKDSRPFLVF